MNISKVFDLSRKITGQSNSSLYTDGYLLDYANIVFHEVENVLAPLDTGLYWAEWLINLTSGTSSYTIPRSTSTSSTLGVKTIEAVEVYKDERIRIQERKIDNQIYSTTDGMWYSIKGNTITLYNTDHETTTNGLKIMGLADMTDLSTSTTENNINIPFQYHYVLALGVAYYIFIEERRLDDANYNKGLYDQKVKEMRLSIINNRRNTVMQDLAPTEL